MKERRREKRIEDGKLNPHSRRYMFRELSDEELQRLADDLKKRGQYKPIEITPNGVIVCGHQRVAAAKLLGLKQIPCRVRHDLTDADPDATSL